MLGHYSAVFFLASVAHAATAKPSPGGIDLASNPLGRRSFTTGHITCIEPGSDAYFVTLSSVLTDSGSIRSENSQHFLEAEIDLDAAKAGSVNIQFRHYRPWYQRWFSSKPVNEKRYLAASPTSNFCRQMGPSLGTYAWLQGAENMAVMAEESSSDQWNCIWPNDHSNPDTSGPPGPTQIWHFEPSTNRLIPRWVNPDGSTFDMHVFHTEIGSEMKYGANFKFSVSALGITGNMSALYFKNSDSYECELMFNPL